MTTPVTTALLAETRRRPGRLLMTGLAIVVATVFAAGTVLLAETLRVYLVNTVQQTPANVDVVVIPGDETTGLDDLAAAVSAVDGVAEAVPVWTAFPTASSGGVVWRVQSDPMTGSLSRVSGALLRGHLPAGDGEVAVGAATAARTGLEPGSTLTLATRNADIARPAASGTGLRVVTVTGVVEVAMEGLDTLVARPELVAALDGTLEQIDVAAAAGVSAPELVDRIARAVGTDVVVRTGAEQRNEEVSQASTTVDVLLVGVGVFAGVALVAAGVVVASTFRIVLTQRRTQLALLRCLGARRRHLVSAVLAEAAISGLVAGLLGIAIALLAGYGVVTVIRVVDPDVPTLVVPWPSLAGCLLVAVLATMLAAWMPARSASRIPPVAALRAAALTDAGVPGRGRRLILAALLVVAAGALAVASRAVSDDLGLLLVVASGLTTFTALVAAGPILVRGLGATVGRAVAAVGRAPGRLGVANAVHVPRRTAAAIAVLALGVGLTSALLVGIATTEAGAQVSIARQFPSEVVIEASSPADAQSVARRLTADSRVTARAEGTVVLADPAPGLEAWQLHHLVDEAVAGHQPALVRYAGETRKEFENTVRQARWFGLGLVGMTLLVAVVGVGVTSALSVAERDRETGLLRAVGLSRRGVRGMVACEAALCGAGAALVGTAAGSAYGALGAHVLGLTTDGVHLPVSSLGVLAAAVTVVAAAAAMLPAIRAARVSPLHALHR